MTKNERWQEGYAEIEEGVLEGILTEDLTKFYGIPYARPPVGELRWKKPQPPQKWMGRRPARQYANAAVQPGPHLDDVYNPFPVFGATQNEDCLYLNVVSPAKNIDEKLPVFVWVHGGGMMVGTAMSKSADGDYIASKGVVFVNINYRLGFYGFFCHPELSAESDDGTCGNYALYDMRQALIWLKKNIASFGGDPDNITVGGQSGGAVGTNCLLISPEMKGLANRIVIESGTCFHGMMQPRTRAEMEQSGLAFARKIGCEHLADLRRLDAIDLFHLTLQNRMMPNYCIDGVFIPEPPQDMMLKGSFNDMDLLVGATAQEFAASLTEDTMQPEQFIAYVNNTFGDKAGSLLSAYPHSTSADAGHSYFTMQSDIHFIGVIRTCELMAKYGKTAYAYYLSRPVIGEGGELMGALHSSELPYLFGQKDHGGKNPDLDIVTWTDAEYQFSKDIVTFWTNFIKTGDPSGVWAKFSQRFDVLNLGRKIRMLEDANSQRLQLIYDIVAPNVYGSAGEYGWKELAMMRPPI